MSEQSNPVVLFLINCGNENLQYLLVPARLDAAMAAIDTDSDGEITAIEWRVSESETFGACWWRRRRPSLSRLTGR